MVRFELPAELHSHYDEGHESRRLTGSALGQLEFERVQALLARHLPPAPAVILDIGGAAGIHALPLARQGYALHLFDPVELHLEQARAASREQPEAPLASVTLADARTIAHDDGSADAVLLFGPLYHLTERAERIAALREARRLLRPGGVLCAIAISRTASLFDGFTRGFIDDPAFVEIMLGDLTDGRHRNPVHHPAYFTTAFFHRPDEFENEIVEAGFGRARLAGVQGPAWALRDMDARWADGHRRSELLRLLDRIETDPIVIACSFHIFAAARVTQGNASDRQEGCGQGSSPP